MQIDILSLFPEMFTGPMTSSIIGKAQERGIAKIELTDFRQFAHNKHGHVDDYPYGGGAGMLLQVQPIDEALQLINDRHPDTQKRVVLMDPAGESFNQAKAEELAQAEHLVFICGHYEGYDERIRNYVTDEISLGDYVLTGGELGAMVVIDATVRLLAETVGNEASITGDSFSTGLLEYPQYTRPREYKGMAVPEVLFSGDHGKIATWKAKEALRRTYERRPDLLDDYPLTDQDKQWLAEFAQSEEDESEEN
ncbi:tRNA (guanosine(37)-N1)-methyltransferase TrmD [Aerococcus kribbianus]|uniref:tRNA (guanine-N(1)-)-methyltransferase n=1 Tax=Aerococcus kribbianus TaxID=2999064 RepID=A0A9X3JEH2_9LACT|nr:MULTISPECIES: tRNA (guanosine(37)-N1)-methyltransferase TrmD [unclassified Aerococcus]MCZ0717139.1 tRNA (guanosine(37)-N1)-methyltransferase TrmD [Aerococcus sp. YH-aer221]MCZ0725427.1 tRNA (guanosine(37)-N1)-methyltransferase TrmD [Aerococcus sp. YH-aer222]